MDKAVFSKLCSKSKKKKKNPKHCSVFVLVLIYQHFKSCGTTETHWD